MQNTTLVLAPRDAGRQLTLDAFDDAVLTDGYQYELIDGALVVSPRGHEIHAIITEFVYNHLRDYARGHRDVLRYVTALARTILPREVSNVEPDVAAFRSFRRARSYEQRPWRDKDPCLVVEIVSPGNPEHDYKTKRALYWRKSSITEYWIVDARDDPDQPRMLALRRGETDWDEVAVPSGETYTTSLLPGFTLDLGRVYEDVDG